LVAGLLELLLLVVRSVRVLATTTTLQLTGKALANIKAEGKFQ
jgi:hypothetical protein